MKKNTIKVDYDVAGHYQTIKVYSVDSKNNRIWGADCILARHKDYKNNKWGKWEINWSSFGSHTYKEMYPYYAPISVAMHILSELDKFKTEKEMTEYIRGQVKLSGGNDFSE